MGTRSEWDTSTAAGAEGTQARSWPGGDRRTVAGEGRKGSSGRRTGREGERSRSRLAEERRPEMGTEKMPGEEDSWRVSSWV